MMKSLSVCFISFNFFPGQGLTELFEYSRKLKNLGHQAYVIAAGRKAERSVELVDGVFVRRIPVQTAWREPKRSFERLRFTFLATMTLCEIVRSNRIDIVHVLSYPFCLVARIAMALCENVKWVYDLRSGPIEVRDKPSLKYGLVRAILKLESRLFDATFVIDDNVRNRVLGDNSKAFLVPLGTDLQFFKPATRNRRGLSRHGIHERDLIVVYSGSLNAARKLSNLILAFRRACTEVRNLRLVVLGEGDDLNHLKSLSQRLSISDRVFFLGYVDYREVPRFLSAADIAVSYVPIFPAFDLQPPLKTIEYLACSLAVIATSTTGNRRFVAHEWNGLLTEDDPKSLSESIIRLSRDAALRESLSQRARGSVKNYDWKTIIEERVLPAYQEILRM